MIKPDGQILVIFGASGDLTKRKLLPSLYELFARDMLPENFVILGVARTPFSDEEFRIQQKDNLKAFLKGKHPEAKQLDAFLERVHYLDSIRMKQPSIICWLRRLPNYGKQKIFRII